MGIVQWTIQNSGDSYTITQSEEIAQLLTSQLTKLDVAANSAVRAQLQEVYTRAPFQSVRQYQTVGGSFLISRTLRSCPLMERSTERVSGVTPPLWLFRGGHLRFSCPSTFKFHPLCGGWILCKMNVLGCLARFYGFSK